MRFRLSLQSIPVSMAAMGLWAIIGGWYVALAPANIAGTDNIGIVLSTFGICLFLADRLAFLWLKLDCWVVIFKIWVWGLAFIAWGFLEWLHAVSKEYFPIFIAHWLVMAMVVAVMTMLVKRRRRQSQETPYPSLFQLK